MRRSGCVRRGMRPRHCSDLPDDALKIVARVRTKSTATAAWSERLTNVRLAAHSGLNSDIEPSPKSSGLMHRRPSHRQAIGDEQCQAVSDDLRLAARPSRVMRPQGPELRLFPVATFLANMVFADVVCR